MVTPGAGRDRILFKSTVKVVTFSMPMGEGGYIFGYSVNIDLKSTKNSVFCILCMPIGRICPRPPLATLLGRRLFATRDHSHSLPTYYLLIAILL